MINYYIIDLHLNMLKRRNILMKNFIFYILILLSFAVSQVSIDSTPKSFLSNQTFNPQEITLPQIDRTLLLEEDRIEMQSSEIKPYRFAKPIPVELNMNNSGTWTILEDGSTVWQLKIKSNGAYSLNFIYDIFYLPPGAEFFLFSED